MKLSYFSLKDNMFKEKKRKKQTNVNFYQTLALSLCFAKFFYLKGLTKKTICDNVFMYASVKKLYKTT